MAIKDAFDISPRAVVCHDVELKGAVSIGSGTVIHPKATIFAINGPIIIGASNIIEENAVVVNRGRAPLVIGDGNLLAVGSRVECSVGSFNSFLPKSAAPATVRITDCCTLGAGVALLPAVDADAALARVEARGPNGSTDDDAERAAVGDAAAAEDLEVLEPYTVLYLYSDGSAADGARVVKRRVWDGTGEEAERDLRAKQVQYLQEMLPRVTRMRAV